MSITLFCLVKGNTPENAFSVKISRDEPISELKDAIKAKKQMTLLVLTQTSSGYGKRKFLTIRTIS